MTIRRSSTERLSDARKASVPTIGKGKPSNMQGNDGDLTFRRTSNALMLYIKANHSWHGVKVGESFSSLEKVINDVKSKVDTMKQFRLPSTYSVTGDFTLDVSGDITLDADGGQVHIKDGGSSHFTFDCDNTRIDIYDDANASDYCRLAVDTNGATTLSTVDADATSANLTLDADGEIEINSATGLIRFVENSIRICEIFNNSPANNQLKVVSPADSSDLFQISTGVSGVSTISTVDSDGGSAAHLKFEPDGSFLVKEVADAGADVAGYGQIWIHDTTPNELCFTDDAGTDIVGIGKYHYETKVTNFYATATANYLPLPGGIAENTSILGRTESLCIVAPYNGTLERAVFRSEIAQNGDLIFSLHESSDGTEAPALSAAGSKTTAINIADDTAQVVDFDSMTSGSNAITKGRIYAIKLTTPSGPQDTVVTLVFKWDTTS